MRARMSTELAKKQGQHSVQSYGLTTGTMNIPNIPAST